MAAEQAKSVVREYFEQFLNEGDGAAADRLLSANFVCHMPAGETLNREQYQQYILGLHSGVPDVRCNAEDMIGEDDRVAVRFTISGTHSGPLQGLPASGKSLNVLSICTYRVSGGQIVEKWLLTDRFGMMQQLGALPAPRA